MVAASGSMILLKEGTGDQSGRSSVRASARDKVSEGLNRDIVQGAAEEFKAPKNRNAAKAPQTTYPDYYTQYDASAA